jgi:phosphoadenosine phosphosulfate reductase
MGLFEDIENLVEQHDNPEDMLKGLGQFTDPRDVTFSTSFGAEDQVITHFLFTQFKDCPIFTLDTGRLFQETYDTFHSTVNKYNLNIEVFSPDSQDLKELYQNQGANGFYESIENRKTCCGVRKVIPLKNALKGKKIWITGLRAEQSENRSDLSKVEYDPHFDIIKVHPILNWTWEQTIEYLNDNGVPVNPLHKKGFPSIGCAPCTRAIEEDEDFRAGRWWWEQSAKECGLHAK